MRSGELMNYGYFCILCPHPIYVYGQGWTGVSKRPGKIKTYRPHVTVRYFLPVLIAKVMDHFTLDIDNIHCAPLKNTQKNFSNIFFKNKPVVINVCALFVK